MKPIGVIGGIGPESTIDYYRAMIAAYQERQPDGSYPAIVISSIDARTLLGLLMAHEHEKVTDHLVAEVERLERAGAGCALVAANSPHIVFDEVQRRSRLPLVSIVEATRDDRLVDHDGRVTAVRLALAIRGDHRAVVVDRRLRSDPADDPDRFHRGSLRA